jgi:hypothetical protein
VELKDLSKELRAMFPGAVNSVETQITADITATSTQITVAGGATLPDAPNTLTIGGDATNAETVRLISKSGNTLTVERAFQGAAKSWEAGTLIARYPTEYDHATFIFNILTNEDGLKAIAAALIKHAKEAVAAEDGAHGIRYYEDALQVYDFEEKEWIDLNVSGGGSSAHLGVAILGISYLGG